MTARSLHQRRAGADVDTIRDDRLALGPAVALHLAPGAVVLTAFLVLARVLGRGVPPQLSLLVAFLVVGVPVELGYLWWWRRSGAPALREAIYYREPVPRGHMAAWVGGLLVWGLLALTALTPLAETIRTSLFGWWPSWLSVAGFVGDLGRYDQRVLWLVVALSVVANIVVPVVEELYFRGHLLARMDDGSAWTPILHTALFSLYHLWIPWEFVSRVVALLPMVYVVRARRNVAIGIWVHVLLNSTGTLGLVAVMLTPT